jgi:FkbM family methyltransferase
MSYKRALVRLLDRPGGRLLLGRLATRLTRRAMGEDIEITYMEGRWTYRVGSELFPAGPRFHYAPPDFDRLKRQAERHASETTDFWLQYYRPQKGDVIVDVGAGRGEDTLTFSRAVGESGRVIAIEAHPMSFAILRKFCQLNRLLNVTPLQAALMDKTGTVDLVESESSWTENAIEHGEGSSGIRVRASTLKEVCEQQGLKDIAFLKMNIEGAERYALLGMEPAIQHVRQICVACHDFRADLGHGEQLRTRAFVEQFLIEHGYTLAAHPNDPHDAIRDHVFGLR